MTDVELDPLIDIDQHPFIEEGIRGGAAMISHRYARANAPGMENYDASKRNIYLMYLDANNLYRWVMSKPLLTSNFECSKTKKLDVMKVPGDSSPEGDIF